MARLLGLFSLLFSLAAASCTRPQIDPPVAADSPVQTFIVQGVLHGIDFAGRSVMVEHEDIPDYMPAMTMPFDVKTMAEVEPLRAGDAIEFKMVVTDTRSWIEGVKKIERSEVRLPEKKQSEGGAAAKVVRLKEGDPMPDFQLTDSKGRHINKATFAGKSLLITFIFTRCPIPNFCPLITNNFREIQQSLVGQPDGTERIQMLSISIDPEFDTPEVLSQYAASHATNTDLWRFASGSLQETKQLAQAFSVTMQPEGATIAHGLATALISADGIIRHIWRGNGWKPAEVLEALHARNQPLQPLTHIKAPPPTYP